MSMTSICPALPIRDTVIFPSMVGTLYVKRSASVEAVMHADTQTPRQLVVVTQRDAHVHDPELSDCHDVAVLVKHFAQ